MAGRDVHPERAENPVAGLKRERGAHVRFSVEEHEYVARKAHEAGQSLNVFMRTRILKNGWRDELCDLKMNQPARLNQLDPRLK